MTKRTEKRTAEDNTETTGRESDEATEVVRSMADEGTTDPNLCPTCGAFLDENHAHKTADGEIEK